MVDIYNMNLHEEVSFGEGTILRVASGWICMTERYSNDEKLDVISTCFVPLCISKNP